MLSDRSYTRDSYGRTSTSTLTWMLCALVAGYLLQVVFNRAFESPYFEHLAGFTSEGVRHGWLWTFVSHALLHTHVIHWLANVACIYFLGRELLPTVGENRLVGLSVAAAILGSTVWFLVHYGRQDTLIGASSITCAFVMLFACLNPNRPRSFLFFFVPVTVKPKHVAWALVVLSTLGLLASELPRDGVETGLAHSAHLGGMLAALLYYRLIHVREWQTPDGRAEIELPGWLSKTPKATAEAPAKFTVNISNRAPTRESLKVEVDRILDKINSQGFAALTPEEKHLLDDARDKLRRP